jgi:hypothetical protein
LSLYGIGELREKAFTADVSGEALLWLRKPALLALAVLQGKGAALKLLTFRHHHDAGACFGDIGVIQ